MGDGGYNLCRDFLIPFSDAECSNPANTQAQRTAKREFNAEFSGARVCVERAIGVLKARFQSLLKGMWFRDMNDYDMVIKSCIIMHNLW